VLDWWLRLAPIVRGTIAIALVVLGIVLFWMRGADGASVGRGRRGGSAALIGLGIVLLFFSWPTDSEKKGYHF
jgi:hypothetical protein